MTHRFPPGFSRIRHGASPPFSLTWTAELMSCRMPWARPMDRYAVCYAKRVSKSAAERDGIHCPELQPRPQPSAVDIVRSGKLRDATCSPGRLAGRGRGAQLGRHQEPLRLDTETSCAGRQRPAVPCPPPRPPAASRESWAWTSAASRAAAPPAASRPRTCTASPRAGPPRRPCLPDTCRPRRCARRRPSRR